MIVDPKTSKATRIGARIVIDEKKGKKRSARISRATGEMLA